MKTHTRIAFVFFLMATVIGLNGCESQLEPAADLTLQTKNAIEVLPADARFVGMVNLQAMQRNSTLSPLMDDLNMQGEMDARVQDFLNATGFDPKQDLREVYVAVPGDDMQGKPSLVAYANFDRDRLLSYVEQNMQDKFARSEYKGIALYQATEADNSFTFALANENMLVASPDVAAVQAMLDRLAGQGQALKDDAETMQLVKQVASGSAWMVARNIDSHTRDHSGEGKSIDQQMEQIGQALQDVAVSAQMQENGAEGIVFMVTREGVSASDVADLTKGVIAAMKASPELDASKLRMLDDIKVRSQGGQVRVDFFVDNATLSSAQ